MDINIPLDQLEHADLVRRARSTDEAYQFKHALVQESAYGSLLKHDRRNLHRACARALEQTYPLALDENAALLAQHYAEAGDDVKTFAYARRAGDAALGMQAYTEAFMHYEMAMGLVERLPLKATELVELYQKRGRTLELVGRYDDAVATYRALEQLGKTREQPQLELGALLSLGTLYTFPNQAQNLQEAGRVNQAALTLAREIHDEPAEARILWNMQQEAYYMGRANESVEYSQQALALTDRLGMRELRAYILNDVSRPMMTAVSVSSALNTLAEARVLWRELNNLPMLVDNLASTSDTAFTGGEVETAEQFAREAQELARTIGNLWNLTYTSVTLMQIAVLRGETAAVLELCREIVGLAQQSGFSPATHFAALETAIVLGEIGEPERGIAMVESVPLSELFVFEQPLRIGGEVHLYLLNDDLSAARATLERASGAANSDDLSTYGPVHIGFARAKLSLREKKYSEALTTTSELLERLRAAGIFVLLPETLLWQGRAYLGLGEWDTADVVLREGETRARALKAHPMLAQILVARAEIETARGNSERAAELKLQAREVIEWLAAMAPPEYQSAFRAHSLARAQIEP